MKNQIEYLYKWNESENNRMWLGILQLSNFQWTASIPYSLGSVHNHIVHVMYATTRWTYALRGMDIMPALQPDSFPDPESAHLRWRGLWKEINDFAIGLTEEELDVVVPWGLPRRGLQGEAPMWQLLNHLTNHALEHRVQVCKLMIDLYDIDMKIP